jgi:aspartyl-tRNA(Asn)/glutamyl-tRNA(Gln) amidotransferase subunit A
LFSTIEKYHQELLSGEISCEKMVAYYLNNIETNTHLNAFVEVYKNEALERAKELDQQRVSGTPLKKLHGVVIALKDVICYKNHKVSAASAILKNFVSTYSASAVQYLLEEDAIIIGNCNCDEFAMGSSNENSVYGNVLNAKNHNKVPGGSSGGSAVAVQADLCMVSLGSDTGGSVRQPADFCGIVGLKPSYGAISRYGLIAYASSFDQIGIFGKNIKDVASVLSVIGKPDTYDSTMNADAIQQDIETHLSVPDKKYTIGVFKQVMNHPSLDKEIAASINNTIVSLQQNGHRIIELEFEMLDYIVPTYYVLTAAEASSNLSRYDGIRFGHQSKKEISDLTDFYIQNRTEGFGKEVKRRIMLGNFVLSSGYYDAYYSKAQKVRKLLVDKTTEIFKECDVIIMPASPSTAFDIGEKNKDNIAMYLADIFTVFANLTGIPAIAVPLYNHSNGMPFGLQVHANKNEELLMLQFSKLLVS